MTDATAGRTPGSFGRITDTLRTAGHWGVALTSLGLVAGLAAWGHDTMTREIEGVPVIKAHAGQMRVSPSGEAGTDVLYRGLTVGRIAEGNGVAPPPDAVRLAATGTDLSTDDFIAAPAAPAAAAPAPEADPVEARRDAVGMAVIGVMTAMSAIPVEVPGVAESPRPIARPALMTGAARAVAGIAAAQAGRELDPSSVVQGQPLAQLGAFPDAEGARAAWAALAARHESLLADRDRLVIEVPVAGRVLWRLRVAGFDTREDAVRFCSALSAAGSECIPTVHG